VESRFVANIKDALGFTLDDAITIAIRRLTQSTARRSSTLRRDV